TTIADPTTGTTGHRWLVNDDVAPGALGMLATLVLADGTDMPDEVLGMESAAILLRGTATWHGDERLLHPGDGVFSPAGSPCLLTATSDSTRLLLIYGRQVYGRQGNSGGMPVNAGVCWRYVVAGQQTDPTLAATGGFADMGVRWLATSDTVGSSSLVVATSTFSPAGHHALHRHPHADEFFLIVDGGGHHLAPLGPIRMGPGDLVFVPAGEWHGYRTDPDTATTAIYGYLGAGSLAQAGYELDQGRVD
ncbi:MAG: cupin domain-containing protein, partial [Pseudonocardiaceae bacterium]